MSRRKLGPHCLSATADGMRLARAGVAVVKFVGLFDGASELAKLPPETRPHLIIGRVVEEEFGIAERMGNDAIEYARSYFARYLEKPIHDQPAISAWEGPNEPTAQSAEGMRWYADFLCELARLIGSVGKMPVIGGWSVGSPDYPYWQYYGRALQAVREHGAVLSRHSYAGPDQSTWPFLLLRHRRDNEIFREMGFPDLPVVLTECGADDAPFGMPPGKAWRDLYGTDGARYAREILIPLEMELRKDDYVIGATLFTFGPAAWWARHNVDGAGVTEALLALPAPEEEEMDTKSLIAAIEAHRLGVMDDLTNVFNHGVEMGKLVEQLSRLPDEPPPAWYTALAVGARLRVLRPLGLMVYLDPGLMNAWKRGRLPIGDTGMKLAKLYDPALDTTPPIGTLCVLLPSPPDFPAGLWIAAMGNDGLPNVAAV